MNSAGARSPIFLTRGFTGTSLCAEVVVRLLALASQLCPVHVPPAGHTAHLEGLRNAHTEVAKSIKPTAPPPLRNSARALFRYLQTPSLGAGFPKFSKDSCPCGEPQHLGALLPRCTPLDLPACQPQQGGT